jgi:tetratricopeptide (TPR) repeat protein
VATLANAQLIELHKDVQTGNPPSNLLQQLLQSDEAVPECEVLDFKSQVPGSDSEYAKTMRDAVALHNSYGGYIVFGVTETEKDRKFRVDGIRGDGIHLQKIKDFVKSYCGADIRLQITSVDIGTARLEVLCVAKRALGETPVRFQKNGPDDKPGNPIFKKNQVVFRRIDCNAVAGPPDDYEFLYSERKPPSLELSTGIVEDDSELVEHNLPDRSLICSRFVGRTASLSELWSWLADDFSRVKLIAGEGGLGKTSLAYRFCEELITRKVKPFTAVVWLSAKKRQFVPSIDGYREANHIDYESAESLFRAICLALGCIESDVAELDQRELMQLALETCQTVPAFLVVDDVDSLTPDDQKSVMEFGLRAPSTIKLLLTTRVNFSYAPENVLKLDGLEGADFTDFVHVLRARYRLPEASAKQIERIHDATGGSPLFTDSLLRLERRGLSLDAAIGQWKGEKGVEARKAALQREVQQLSKEAKRVLYVTSLLKNCSYTELTQIIGYSDQTLGDALQELSSLFLINAPAIAKEARYTVEPNTGALVLEIGPSLAIDHTALQQQTKRARTDAVGLSLHKRTDIVGLAISQAIAKLKNRDAKGALEGVVETSKKLSKPHPDLMLMIGRCHLKLSPPNYSDAAKQFEQAYVLGQRKTLLFELWFQAEYGRQDLDAAMTVIDYALEQPEIELKDWYERRAQIRIERAQRRSRTGSTDFLRREIDDAITDLQSASRYVRTSAETERIGRMISQAYGIKAHILKTDVGLTPSGLKALDDLLKLAHHSAADPEVLTYYFEALIATTNSAISKYVGRPIGSEREQLEMHQRKAKGIGEESIAKGIPATARHSFHQMCQVIDRYMAKRVI